MQGEPDSQPLVRITFVYSKDIDPAKSFVARFLCGSADGSGVRWLRKSQIDPRDWSLLDRFQSSPPMGLPHAVPPPCDPSAAKHAPEHARDTLWDRILSEERRSQPKMSSATGVRRVHRRSPTRSSTYRPVSLDAPYVPSFVAPVSPCCQPPELGSFRYREPLQQPETGPTHSFGYIPDCGDLSWFYDPIQLSWLLYFITETTSTTRESF